MSTRVGFDYVLPEVSPETGTIYGYDAGDLQSDVEVAEGAITGTLAFVSTGQLAEYWGSGYFLALKASDGDSHATSTKVGLVPSEGSGLVELDEDRNFAACITDPQTQQFAIVSSDGKGKHWQYFDLSQLVLGEEVVEEDEMT